jgi:competence protein ComEA
MQKYKSLLFPLLALCFLLVMTGYFLGRQSAAGAVLTTQRAAPAETGAVPESFPGQTGTPDRALPGVDAPDRTAAAGRLDLNRATLEELMALPGIGEARAQRILDYRAEHGPFRQAAELMNVSGIGEKIYAGLRDLVYVEESDENSDH